MTVPASPRPMQSPACPDGLPSRDPTPVLRLANGPLGASARIETGELWLEPGHAALAVQQKGRRTRIPLGAFRFPLPNACTCRLNTRTSEVEVLRTGDVFMSIRVQADEPVLVVEWPHGGETEDWAWHPASKDAPHPAATTGLFCGSMGRKGQWCLSWQFERSPGRMVIALAATYPEACAHPLVHDTLHRFLSRPAGKSLRDHHLHWTRFHHQSRIHLPDHRLQGWFEQQDNLAGSVFREDADLPDGWGPWLDPRGGTAPSPLILAPSLSVCLPAHRHDAASHLVRQWAGLVNPDTSPWIMLRLCQMGWQVYRHTLDLTLLDDILHPLLHQALEALLPRITMDKQCMLHIRGPERRRDANQDLAWLRWGCSVLIEVDMILGMADDQLETWEELLDNLAPPSVNMGNLVRSDTPEHALAHLAGFCPLYMLSPRDPVLRQLLDATLNNTPVDGDPVALARGASLNTLLGKGDKAVASLHALMDLPPEGIPPSVGWIGVRAVYDLLIGTWDDTLHLLPGIPDSWEYLEMKHLSAEGGFTVSLRMKQGKVTSLDIQSRGGEPCVITCPRADFVYAKLSGAKVLAIASGQMELRIEAGDTARLRWKVSP